MGKPRKSRVRAQRKFAQGAYVPPQSTSLSAPPQGQTVNASHKALSGPGRVTKNVCSAKDLLTRMSLGKAHHHTINWPIVVLEDCANIVNTELHKKKLVVKKKHNRILRNTRDSVSDSGEDTPLSHLQNQLVSSKHEKNVPVGDTEGTVSSTTKIDTEKANDHVNPTSEKKNSKRTNGLDKFLKVIVQPIELKKRNIETPPQQEPPKTRCLNRHYDQYDNIQRSERYSRSRPRYDDNALLTPVSSTDYNEPSSIQKKKRAATKNTKRSKPKVIRKTFHRKSHKPSVTHTNKTQQHVSKKKKKNDFMKKRARHSPQPAVPSTSTSTSSVMHNDKQQNQSEEHIEEKLFLDLDPDTKDNQAIEYIFNLEDDDDNMLDSVIITNVKTLIEDEVDPVKLKPTAHSSCESLSMDLELFRKQPMPETIDLTSFDSFEDTNVKSCNDLDMDTVQPEGTVSSESSDSFKVPTVPARFTQRAITHCPLMPIVDLHELLSSGIGCNTCRRCTLVTMYRKILISMSMSRGDEQYPPCTDGSSDQRSNKYMTQREKINYVLTPKRLPIWLINFEMDLDDMQMFEVSHRASTLKRSLNIDPEDAPDALIEEVITRLEYLNRCIIQDIIGLKLVEQPMPSDNTQKIKTDDNVAEASTSAAESHFPVVCLTPLPEVPGLVGNQPMDTNIELAQPERPTPLPELEKPPPLPEEPGLAGYQAVDTSTEQARFEQPSPLPEEPGLVGNQAVGINTEQAQLERSPPLPEVPGLVGNQADDTNTEQARPEQTPPPPEVPGLVGNQAVDTNTEQTQTEPPSSPIIANNDPILQITFNEALVYHPTVKEFEDPITYIRSIEPEASTYGMCKIIPPDGFHVPCHLDESCMFGTTNQHLARLYHRWGPNTREFAAMQTYLTSQTPRNKERFTKAPLFGGVEVDLVKLYHLVLKKGGIEGYLADTEKWARIAAEMNFVSACSKPDWKKLEKIYCKHVLPYESLTGAERQAAFEKADEMWEIRVKNAILRAKHPLHYQNATLSDSNLPEYEEAFPDADLADLYNICKPIYDKIEECIGKGRAMNLATFRRISTHIQRMRFPNGLPSVAEIERQYWEILNHRDEHVCVLSAFIDTSVNNLGHESNPKAPGGSHPWNLKRIGENPKNILRSLGKTLSVTVPTLCLNQLYSSNCWHKDPHKMAWIDYMHEGATKIWYSVPSSGAPAFRRAVQRMTEAAVQDKGIWLASDTTMIPPGNLLACGVPISRIEQNPNEYIVVFPGAYASSISTGLSVAESIYFVTNRWLNRAEQVFEEMHKDCEPAMFSCVLLMMNMARNPTISSNVLRRVYSVLKRFIKKEFQARREAQWLNCKVTTDKRGREEGNLLPVSWPNQEECCLCRIPLVLSKMSKYDEPRKQMCITHGTQYMRLVNVRPEEERPEHPPVLTLHYTNQELIEMMGTMELYKKSRSAKYR